MLKYVVKNTEGAQVSEAELSAEVFETTPNISVVHQVVVCQDACYRQGTHSTKNRHDVSGGGAKPYRQKGTGRARQGSTRAGQWTGGGVIFGPTPRSHAKRINNKMVKLAMRSVLSGKAADGELVLVDDYAFDKVSTKKAVAFLKALNIADKRVTLVVADDDIVTYLSFRNLQNVLVIGATEATTRTLIDNGALVMTAAIAQQYGEVLV